jgi:hypothetical protein
MDNWGVFKFACCATILMMSSIALVDWVAPNFLKYWTPVALITAAHFASYAFTYVLTSGMEL